MKRLITLILFLGCNKNIKDLTTKNKIGEIYWQYIIEDKDEELKEYLENNDTDINKEKNQDGETALTLAAKHNSLDVLKLLLDKKGIDVNTLNEKGQTALILSILKTEGIIERDEIISKLLEKDANVNIRYGLHGNNALMLSIIRGDSFIAGKILRYNIDVNAQNIYKETALILAVKSDIDEDKKIETINLLIKHKGINIDVQDSEGKNALTYAVINNITKIVNILSNMDKVDINILDKENMTPLDHLNFEDFEIELAISLIKNGGKLNNKRYFYARAREEHLEDILGLLIEGEGDVNYIKDGKNLLYWSITLFDSKISVSLKLAKYLIREMKLDLNSLREYIEYAEERNSDIFYLISIFYDQESFFQDTLQFKNRNEKIKQYFFKALSSRDVKALKILLNKGIEINEKYDNGSTALLIASEKGDKEIVKLLLDNGASVHDKDNDGDTALILASETGNKEIVKLLIECGANVNYRNNKGSTSLILASRMGKIEIVKILLEEKANINEKDNDGITALMIASEEGNKEIVKFLIENGAEIKSKAKNGEGVLISGVYSNNKEIVELLINEGASVGDKGNSNHTALMLASKLGNKEIVKLLIDKGANIDDIDMYGYTALMMAREEGHFEISRFLKEIGANIHDKDSDISISRILAMSKSKNKFQKSLREENEDEEEDEEEDNEHKNVINNYDISLLSAIEECKLEAVKFLIDLGANVNYKKKNYYTPLIVAVEEGHLEIAKLLIEYGANINDTDSDGNTILMIALGEDHSEIAKVLIEHGANIDNKNGYGSTALTIAVEKGYLEIVSLLIEYGANINDIDSNGTNVLIIAVEEGHLETANLLIKYGANIDDTDIDGKTPLMLAVEEGHLEIVKSILKEATKYKNIKEFLILFAEIIKENKEIIKDNKKNSKSIENSQIIEENKNYLIACKYILGEMIKENVVLYSSLEKINQLENNKNLEKEKKELKRKIEILKMVLNLPLEVFELVVRFI